MFLLQGLISYIKNNTEKLLNILPLDAVENLVSSGLPIKTSYHQDAQIGVSKP